MVTTKRLVVELVSFALIFISATWMLRSPYCLDSRSTESLVYCNYFKFVLAVDLLAMIVLGFRLFRQLWNVPR
jgi:hypothetical protein